MRQPATIALDQLPDWVLCATGLPAGYEWQPRPMPDGHAEMLGINQAWWDRAELYRAHHEAAGPWLQQHAPGVTTADLQRETHRRVREEWRDYQ